MDYYKMQNVQADTEMRQAISGQGKGIGSGNQGK
jgi:uncharacterized protein YqfA (UPF0365 family)